MPLSTNGFESIKQLKHHFQEHGADFSASNFNDYERMADEFLGLAKPETAHECARRCGAKLRYDPTTEAFGVLDRDGIIRTYYKPMPCSRLPGAVRETERLAGRCHKCANNLVYFKQECEK